MEEKKLLQIALISGIVGIIILFIVSERINLEVSNINSITLKNFNQEVKIRGTITSIKETTKLRIIDVKDETNSITIISFSKELPLEKDTKIEVQGKIIKYKDQPEIQARTIKIIQNVH